MKKFLSIYILIFIVFIFGTIIIDKVFYSYNTEEENIILAKDYLEKDNYNEPKKITDTYEVGDVGKINQNYAKNYKIILHGQNDEINPRKVLEVQLYLSGGEPLSNVYYSSKNKDEIRKLIKSTVGDEEDIKKGYSRCEVVFIMNDKKYISELVDLNNNEINRIKVNYTKPKIVISENAKIGVEKNDNLLDFLDYTKEEEKQIVEALSKISPLYEGNIGHYGSISAYDFIHDYFFIYQKENKEEIAYAYNQSDSLELTRILNKINQRNINKIFNSKDLESVYIVEYRNNKAEKYYYTKNLIESFKEYVKNHPIGNYAEGDYYKIWFESLYEVYYISYPINDDIKNLINRKGVSVYD